MAEPRPSHPEERDVSPRGLTIFAGVFVLFIAVTLAGLGLIFDTASVWPIGGSAERGDANAPALQLAPEADLAALRAREEKELHELGWVDRNAGLARVPIETAMAMIAAGGLPDWSATAAGTGECQLLLSNAPRAPQAANCRSSGSGPKGAGR